MTIVIFTNGDYRDEEFYKGILKRADLIICADGGGDYLYKWGIRPDLLIGDMDSISKEALESFKGSGVEVKLFPSDKDYTDTHLALIEALRYAPSEVLILGGIGTRLDHIIGNIHLLLFALKRGVKAKLVNEFYEVQLISEGESLIEAWGEKVSLLPLTPEVKFSYSDGLKWPLLNLSLTFEHPIGISNEPLSPIFKIKVEEGIAILFQVREV
ncbi:MAG: thiamine diphosphokinase [Synergistetes bacterium]|nr:thiamine diphosphokinase [Synergistota bacterium]MDW8192917.1 thiamine diphosphokinase [Synergistota bacterium]